MGLGDERLGNLTLRSSLPQSQTTKTMETLGLKQRKHQKSVTFGARGEMKTPDQNYTSTLALEERLHTAPAVNTERLDSGPLQIEPFSPSPNWQLRTSVASKSSGSSGMQGI